MSILLVILSLLIAQPAWSTTVLKLDISEMSELAQTIITGHCLSKRTEIDPKDNNIYTYATFKVNQVLKGDLPGDSIAVRHPGGRVGDEISIVPGVPDFNLDEEVLLFLSSEDDAGYPWVVGLSQGKFHIQKDKISGKKITFADPHGLSLYDKKEARISPSAKRVIVPLDQLIESIQTILRTEADSETDPRK